MKKTLFIIWMCVAAFLLGCDTNKNRFFSPPRPTPPPDLYESEDAAVSGRAYLSAVADAFDAHAANLEGTVPEDVSVKAMRKTLTVAPEAAFLPLMREMQAVSGDHTTCRQANSPNQRQIRAAMSRKYAKRLRGMK